MHGLNHSKTCYTWSVILGLRDKPMRRRQFIALLGSGVAAWPLAARAQQQRYLVGHLARRHADNENQSAEAEISGMKSGARERRLLILHRDILVRFQSQKLNNADLVFIDLCRVLRGRYRAAETRLRGWGGRTRSAPGGRQGVGGASPLR
jgi:hypothetical protein